MSNPQGIDARYGDIVEFNCISSGGPNNQYKWTHLSSGEAVGMEPILSLRLISLDQFGEYECFVSNEAGTGNDTSFINGILSVEVISDRIVVLQFGQTFHLNCSIVGLMNDSDIQITWYHNDVMLSSTSQILPITYNDHQSVNQGGTYKCNVSGSDDESSSGESTSILIIFAPYIVVEPSSIRTVAESEEELTCTATGYPLPTIEWRRVSVVNSLSRIQDIDTVTIELPQNITNRSTTTPMNNTSTLTISSVEYEDYGYYICIAKLSSLEILVLSDYSNVSVTDYYSISPTAILSVSPQRSVTTEPLFIFSQFGDSVTLNCTSRGGPNNQYIWTQYNSSQIIGNNSILSLSLVSRDLFEEYICTASNDAGIGTSSSYVYGLLSVTTIPSNTTVLEFGQSVTLTCSIDDDIDTSDLNYVWYYNNVYITDRNPVIEINYTDYSSVNTAGNYSCHVYSDNFFLRGSSQNVSILFAPVLVDQPASVNSRVNDTVEFTCSAFGYPSPTIQWKRITQFANLSTLQDIETIATELPLSSGNDTDTCATNVTSTLIIDPVDYDDFGYYVCVVTIPAHESILNFDTFHVFSSVAVLSVSPEGSIAVSPDNINALLYDIVTINCTSSGGPDNIYQWEVSAGIMIEIFNESQLVITNVSVLDGGSYTCTVKNRAGRDNSTATLNVGPVILNHPSSLDVSLNSDPILVCTVSGIPLPNVTWTHNASFSSTASGDDSMFLSSNDTIVSYGTIQSQLNLESVTLYDSGQYQCHAVSSEYDPTVSNIANLNVVVSPMLLSGVNNLTENASSTVTLSCTFSGYPMPVITWFSSENGISREPLISRQINITSIVALPSLDNGGYTITSQLTIQNLLGSDQRFYECLAMEPILNTTDSSLAYLTVQVPPNISSVDNQATVKEGDTVVLTFFISGASPDISPNQIMWSFISASGVINEIRSSGHYNLSIDRTSLTLTNAERTYRGNYTITVSHETGTYFSNIELFVTVSPETVTSPVSVVVNVTDMARLSCTFQSYPPLSFIEWYFMTPDRVLNNSLEISISFNSVTNATDGTVIAMSSLTIRNVTIADDGQYVCRADSFLHEAANITVQSPPTVRAVNATVIGIITRQIILEFIITNDVPTVQSDDIQWKINGTEQELSAGQRVMFSANRRSVTITNLSLSDEGSYTLVATNPAGESRDTLYLDIEVPPVIIEGPENRSELFGRIAVFHCLVEAEPAHIIEWLHDGDVIPSRREKYQLTRSKDQLTVIDLTLDDAGVYVCVASNVHGTNNASATLLVQVPPSIWSNLRDVNITAGDEISFTCNSTGFPPPTITWYKNNVTITESRELVPDGVYITSYVVGSTLSVSYLYIQGVDLSTGGSYHCQSENSLVEVFRSISEIGSLQVLVPPDLVIGFNMTVYNTSDTLRLFCVFSSQPISEIVWHRDVVATAALETIVTNNRTSILSLSEEELEEISSGSGSGQDTDLLGVFETVQMPSVLPVALSILQIDNLRYDDEGTYMCTATNNVANLINSTVSNTAFITVQRVPVVSPYQSAALVGIYGRSVTLSFNITEDNPFVTPENIQWLFNATELSADMRMVFSADRRSVTIYNLQLTDEGNYTLIASNAAGSSRADIYLDVEVSPVVIEGTNSIDALTGTNATFICHVQSEPTHITQWFFHEQPLTLSNKHIITGNSTNYGTLTITEVQYADAGEYTCIAINVHGQTNATGILTVQVPPVIIDHPSNATKVVGQNVTYRCSATGYPPPTITWIHSGGLMSGANISRVIFAGNSTSPPHVESQYILVYLNLTDQGSYRCIATNDLVRKISSNSATADLSLQHPANVTVIPEVLVKSFREVGTFTCRGFGIIIPLLSWYRDNALIIPSSKFSLSSNLTDENGYTMAYLTLNISNTSKSDEGVYECRGVNNVINLIGAIDRASGRFLIESSPIVRPAVSNVTGLVGKSIVLTFEVIQAAPLIVASNVSWLFTPTSGQQRTLPSDSRYSYSNENLILTISNLDFNDEGQYNITTINRIGRDTAIINLKIDADPVITTAPSNMSVVSRKFVDLTCSATAKPPAVIVWSFKGQRINPAGSTKYNQSSGGSLTVDVVSIEDEGTYQCTASNIHSSVSASAFVAVQDPPFFTQNPNSTNGTVSLFSILTCHVRGHPLPDVYWFKGNEELHDSLGSGVKYVTMTSIQDPYNRESSITIFDLDYDDDGEYYCQANNTLFEARQQQSTRAQFRVHYPPDLQSGISDLIKNESDTLMLHCQFTGTPPPSITWYRNVSQVNAIIRNIRNKIRIREEKSDENRQTNSYLEIFDLVKEDEGTYSCRGFNDVANHIGAEDTSIAFITIYVPPTIYPIDRKYSVVGVKDYNYELGFIIQFDFPPVQLHNIQWNFTNLENVTVNLLLNGTRDTRHTFSEDLQRLTIADVQLSDRGYYSLTATNEAGVRNSTLYLDVHVQPKLLNDTGGHLVVNATGSSQSVTMNCSADGIPPPNILWRRNGLLVLNTTRITITDSPVPDSQRDIRVATIPEIKQTYSQIVITNVRETDNGNYTCRADNSAGMADILDTPYQLNVTYLPPPKFCEVNRAILGQFCQNGGTCVDLTGGRYECLCTDRYTGDSCSEEVVIEIPPSLTLVEAVVGLERKQYSLLPPNNATGEFFQPMNLTCYSTGNPRPTTTWFKNGNEFYNLSNTLEFPELNLTNRGFYKCAVSNRLGTIPSDTVLVNITGIAQYKMDIDVSNSTITDAIQLNNLITEMNNEIVGGTLTGTNGRFASVVLKTNTSQGLTTNNVAVIVTILIDHSDPQVQSFLQEYMSRLQINARIENSTIIRFDGCPANKTELPGPPGFEDLFLVLEWPETNLGDSATIECPCGGLDLNSTGLIATRRCGGSYDNGAFWEIPYDVRCDFSITTRRICRLAERPAEEKVEELVALTNNTQTFETAEVTASVAVLVTATEDVAGNITLTENFLSVVDNIVSTDIETLQESNTEARTSTKLLSAVQDLSEAIPAVVGEPPVVITQRSFSVAVQEVRADDFEESGGQTISANIADNMQGVGIGFNSSSVTNTPPTASLALPSNLFRRTTSNSTRITNSVYLTDALFLRRDTKDMLVGSIILSAGVAGEERVYNLTDPTVNMEFQKSSAAENGTDTQCVFWDITLDDGFGDWSTDGCMVNRTAYNDSQPRVLCHCNHLTSFSILLDVSPEVGNVEQNRSFDKALSGVTYIGVIISIFCLIITILSYSTNKKLRSSDHGQLLLNLCYAFVGLYIMFILAIHSKGVHVLCAIVAILLQYFFLVAFMLMAAEAVNLYLKLVVVLGGNIQHYVLKAALLSWILPVFIVIFCFAPDYHNYYRPHFCRAFDLPFYLGMVAPFAIIYIFNWIVFVIIFTSLIRKSCKKKLKDVKETDKKGNDMKSQLKQQFIIAVTLSILFGLGWGIGLPATQSLHDTAVVRDIFASFFVLLTAFQGMFIFIMHCLRSPEIRKVWASWFKIATGKEVTDFTSSVISKPRRRTTSENTYSTYNEKSSKFAEKGKFKAKGTSNAYEEFSFTSNPDDQSKRSTLQRNVEKSGLLDSMGTLERFGQGRPFAMPHIIEDIEDDDKHRASPVMIENVETISDEDPVDAELEYAVKSFQLPEGFTSVEDIRSIGGLTVVSEDGNKCIVFENPIEMEQLDPFAGVSHSTSQHSFKSGDFLDNTAFTNPFFGDHDDDQ